MALSMMDLTLPKEKTYFKIILVVAVIAWICVAITIIGIAYGLVIALFVWLTNGLFVARLKSECVLVNEKQLPKLHETFKQVCEQLEITKIPELYVLEAGGMLNAFAIRHSGRDFVVVLSDIVEAYGEDSDEIRFLLGHELGHIKSKHVFKQILLMPCSWLPILGPAYSRACEASCDRYGAFVTRDMDGAVRAMMIMSGGKQMGKTMSSENFSDQYKNHRGFFVSWYELISGYPTASQRVANLMALKSGTEPQRLGRHPLAFLFAFFTFGGNMGGGGNFLTTLVVIALVAAIAIPNLLRAKIAANDHRAQQTLTQLAKASSAYAKDHGGRYPTAIDQLMGSNKKYVQANVCGQNIQGFRFACSFSAASFLFTATPLVVGETGSEVFSISSRDMEDVPKDLAGAKKKVEADFLKLQEFVENYREETGQWPSDVQGSLTGEWISSRANEGEPYDPFDRQPYGYRKFDDHYELISVGPDTEINTKDDIVFKSQSAAQ